MKKLYTDPIIIVRMKFGSHIYGTDTSNSDTDYKGVILPKAEDILLQRVPRTIVEGTKSDPTARNTAQDVDSELFGVQQYLKLLMEGQTGALDMLFTPEKFYTQEAHPFWTTIKSAKGEFLHRGTSAFVGYTKQQAAKYGVKGFRINAMQAVLEWLNTKEDYWKLRDQDPAKFVEALDNEYVKVVFCKGPNGTEEPHLEVCNRKIPFHATIKYTREIFQRIFDEWGHRARLAAANQGIDWKALSHAVRVAGEAKELLLTGHITFPRPDAAFLLQIKKGELPYQKVAEIIEQGLIDVDLAKEKSTLPAEPNYKLADELVLSMHEFSVRSRKP